MMKWIKRILLTLLLLVILGVAWAYFWLNGSKPENTGQFQLKGLQTKVDVHYDDFGIPHIYAENNHDLYMAFGYVHAKDRLFQMEMLRRAGGGRLAEIIGHPLLKVDKMFRTLGLTEYARESAAYMETQKGTPMYEDMQAYLEGLNFYLANGETPPEFSIIGIEKKPFTIEDLYLITGAMSFSFSQAQKTEPVVDYMSRNYDQSYLQDLGLWHDSLESYIPSTNKLKDTGPVRKIPKEYKPSEPVIDGISARVSDPAMEMAEVMNEMEDLLPFAPLEGSNSWVVSPKKTVSNNVLFCNDTHIGYLLPQTWYEAHLVSPKMELYGHFMAGVPFALVGRNRELSWGLTMLLNDDMDFYYEEVDPNNRNQYKHKGEWKTAQEIEHVIKIKDQADTTIKVRHTIHGPVVNDIFDECDEMNAMSMFWTYTHLPNRTMDAFYGLNNAHDLETFRKNLPLIHAPGLNMNYGDKEGNVAWWACASLIKRREGVNSWTVLEGVSGNDDPLGYYAFEENPRAINPESGFIYSANDWPQAMEDSTGASGLLWYPGYYKPQYRADRIRKLLEEHNDWDLTSMQAVMTDSKNEADSSLMRWFADELDSVKAIHDSVFFDQYNYLFDWNGDYDPSLAQPSLFNSMLYNYLHLALADEMGEDRFKLFLQTHQVQRTQNLLFGHKDSKWWDDIRTEKKETRRDIVYRAYCHALDQLREEYGNNPKVWVWRKTCQLELKHPLGEVAVFKPFFNVGPRSVYGGNETILQSGFKLDSTGHFKVFFGSQMRIMVDFANVDSSLNITPAGQSGHLMNDHYKDQFELYCDKKFRPAFMGKERIAKFEKMELVP
ncbi:MAG: penicillin acylase family protein [Flavobacteriales bacterium]